MFCRSNFAAAWMNLGVVQATMSKYIEAESSYLRALRHRKKYPDCYHNLGNLVCFISHVPIVANAMMKYHH